MEDRVLLIIEFGVEVLRNWYGMTVLFGAKLRKTWVAAVCWVVFALFSLIERITIDVLGLCLWIFIVIEFMITVKAPKGKGLVWKICCGCGLWYMIELMSVVLDCIFVFLAIENIDICVAQLIESILVFAISILIGTIYKHIKRMQQKEKLHSRFRRMMIPMLVLVTMELVLVIQILNNIMDMIGNLVAKRIIVILCLSAIIGVGILVMVVFYVKKMNEKMEQSLYMEKQVKNLEGQYYETLLKKEEDTRRYRHDMTGHLACLGGLIDVGDIDDAKEYIDDMLNQMLMIQKKNHETGNKVLNILLNYYTEQLDEDVEISVTGECKGDTCISDVDMCTIFSNLLKNAVEAIHTCQQTNRYLAVEVKNGAQYVRVKIINSMPEKEVVINEVGTIKTTKEDKRNHGIGMLNVQETVQLNKGNFYYQANGNQFYCQVMLPIEQSARSTS